MNRRIVDILCESRPPGRDLERPRESLADATHEALQRAIAALVAHEDRAERLLHGRLGLEQAGAENGHVFFIGFQGNLMRRQARRIGLEHPHLGLVVRDEQGGATAYRELTQRIDIGAHIGRRNAIPMQGMLVVSTMAVVAIIDRHEGLNERFLHVRFQAERGHEAEREEVERNPMARGNPDFLQRRRAVADRPGIFMPDAHFTKALVRQPQHPVA